MKKWLVLVIFSTLLLGCGKGRIIYHGYDHYQPGYYHYHYYPSCYTYDVPLGIVIQIDGFSYYQVKFLDLYQWIDYDWDGLIDYNELLYIPCEIYYSDSQNEWLIYPTTLKPKNTYLFFLDTCYGIQIWYFQTTCTDHEVFYYLDFDKKEAIKTTEKSLTDFKKVELKKFELGKGARNEPSHKH